MSETLGWSSTTIPWETSTMRASLTAFLVTSTCADTTKRSPSLSRSQERSVAAHWLITPEGQVMMQVVSSPCSTWSAAKASAPSAVLPAPGACAASSMRRASGDSSCFTQAFCVSSGSSSLPSMSCERSMPTPPPIPLRSSMVVRGDLPRWARASLGILPRAAAGPRGRSGLVGDATPHAGSTSPRTGVLGRALEEGHDRGLGVDGGLRHRGRSGSAGRDVERTRVPAADLEGADQREHVPAASRVTRA